jgi:rSAM/selenodomain-associated transferase 1
VPGQVKTRLCQGAAALGLAEAARVHTAFVADVCRSGAESGIPRRRLYVAGAPPASPLSLAADGPADGELASSLQSANQRLADIAAAHGFALRPQVGADLGARMDAAIARELGDGASAVVLIGTDSPTLPSAYLRHAAALLHGPAAVVLGPAADGGYYLVGARQPIPALFAAGVAWSTDQVLPTTLLRLAELQRRGVPVALLPFFYDIDTPQDLRLLAAHLQLAAADPAAPTDATPCPWEITRPHAPATAALLRELGWS